MKIETLDVFFLNKPTSNDIEKNDLLDFFYKEKKSGNILKRWNNCRTKFFRR